jgi:hypothetical protein
MTVVPVSYQLCGWIPAWWSGSAGGDDLIDLLGADIVANLRPLRATTIALTAYSPELGVGVLPGPKPVTEAAVAAGQAVILHAQAGQPSTVLIPGDGLHAASPARPVDLDLRQASSDFAQAVVTAEHEIRSSGLRVTADAPALSVRPLPPGAESARKALLVRAVRMWTAVAAVAPELRTAALQEVLVASARATLAAYVQAPIPSSDRARRFA